MLIIIRPAFKKYKFQAFSKCLNWRLAKLEDLFREGVPELGSHSREASLPGLLSAELLGVMQRRLCPHDLAQSSIIAL